MEEIIYLEVDSEITEAIDKLKNVDAKEVRLVVPARSSLLGSVVNLKLLKKSADESKKDLVLVTSDKTAKFLAGRIGLAVASSVKAEAKVPEVPDEAEKPDIDEAAEVAIAAAAAKSKKAKKEAGEDADEEPEDDSPMSSKSLEDNEPAPKRAKKGKQAKIPNYNAFQKKLFVGISIVLGVIAAIILLNLLPGAKVIITAQAEKKAVKLDFKANAAVTTSDYEKGILAAKKLSSTSSLNTSFNATGKKDVGAKATGTIAVKNCDNANVQSLPAGSKMIASGKNFTTDTAISIPGGTTGGGKVNCSSSVNVAVTAEKAGEDYNISSGTVFAIPSMPPLINGTGSTSGGTTKQVTVVSQNDIDAAKATMIDGNKSKAQTELNDKAGKSFTTFADTFTPTVSDFKSSVAVDTEAASATVSATVDYSMLAVENSILDQYFDASIKSEIKADNEIYDNGRESATYKVIKQDSADLANIGAVSTAYVGAKIDKDAIAKSVAGKSKKDVSSIVKASTPSAETVAVDAFPFWPSMPHLSSHITVEIKVNTN